MNQVEEDKNSSSVDAENLAAAETADGQSGLVGRDQDPDHEMYQLCPDGIQDISSGESSGLPKPQELESTHTQNLCPHCHGTGLFDRLHNVDCGACKR